MNSALVSDCCMIEGFFGGVTPTPVDLAYTMHATRGHWGLWGWECALTKHILGGGGVTMRDATHLIAYSNLWSYSIAAAVRGRCRCEGAEMSLIRENRNSLMRVQSSYQITPGTCWSYKIAPHRSRNIAGIRILTNTLLLLPLRRISSYR